MGAVLDAAGADSSALAMPPRGTWPNFSSAETQLDRTQAVLVQALGIPSGWAGAVEFESTDRERLIAVLVAQFLEPVNDLLVLPKAGKAFVEFSHHDVVHISCASSEGIEAIIKAMATARYDLPDELPDATFKRPAWM